MVSSFLPAISGKYLVKKDVKVLWTSIFSLICLLYSKYFFLDCGWIRTLCYCNSASQLIGYQLSINFAYLHVPKHLTLPLKETGNSYFHVTPPKNQVLHESTPHFLRDISLTGSDYCTARKPTKKVYFWYALGP